MPNWCNNFVQISHPDSAKLEALAQAVREGGFCKHVIPVPEDLNIVAGRVGADDNPDQIELERKSAENKAKYGVANWYDFCVSRWGTKWDIDAYEGEGVKVENGLLAFGFDSAWSPPTGIYEALTEDGFTVDAMYYEPGMGFCGRWMDGCDDSYNLCDMTADEVADSIDPDIDEQFGITETMREYEEMEKDEVTQWYEEGVEVKGLEPHK